MLVFCSSGLPVNGLCPGRGFEPNLDKGVPKTLKK